jgi:predicted polyphosphate/ATP-dependent NAD kinase
MSEGITVLVCGGRDFSDAESVWEVLDLLDSERRIEFIVAGDAAGADALAHKWANERSRDHTMYVAHWSLHGNAAGPIRNQRMLDEESIDVVIAFPGGRGTADMTRRAVEAGIPVLETGPKSRANLGAAETPLSIEQPHQSKIPTQPQGEGEAS